MTGGWTWYVIILVAINIVGYVWLLWWTSRRRPGDPKPEDTSHVWDGDITEYNKPLPKWWINLFYLTIVFGVAYLAWFGGLGGIRGYSGWTSTQEHAADKAVEDAKLEQTFAPFAGKAIDALATDPTAVALGRSIFSNTCATCHGSTGQGAIGYPNLTDDIWHWGGAPDQILTGMGGPEAVDYTIAYVRTLSDPDSLQNNFMAARGRKLYEGVCAACHGVDGKGNQDLGAPDLTDAYWMYGSSRESLRQTIAHGRHGSMPAHRELLGETRARLVAAYVWSLSHNEATTGSQQGTR